MLSVSIALWAATAAGPVYLDCYFDEQTARRSWILILDEKHSWITAKNPAPTWIQAATETPEFADPLKNRISPTAGKFRGIRRAPFSSTPNEPVKFPGVCAHS